MHQNVEWSTVRDVPGGNGYRYKLGAFPNGKFVVNDVYAIIDGVEAGGSNVSGSAFDSREAAHAAALKRAREHGWKG